MTWNPQARRRWLGIACLLLAIGMLAGDKAVLKDPPARVGFVGYWLACLLFITIAIGCAFRDVREVRRQTREEQRALFESTLKDVPRGKIRR